MQVEIQQRPGCAVTKINLAPNETIVSEGGAMIAMSDDMRIETSALKKSGSSMFGALKRMLSGENFFLNYFTASNAGGELWLGTTLPGDMEVYEMQNETIILQGGAFVASSTDIKMDMGWQGFKSLFSGESIFWVQMSGTGKVVFNSFGAIYPVEVDGEYIVDTGHIVAFTENLNFSISKAGKSIISSFLGGEGLVCKFKGKGTVWCQSHNESNFGFSIGNLLKVRK